MGQIPRADSFARRAAVAIVASGALIGGVLIAATGRFRPELEAWLKQDVSARLTPVAVAVTICTTGPLFGLVVYLWRLGGHEPAAVHRGRLMQWLAVVLGLASVLLAFFMWRLVMTLRTAM